MNLKQNPELIPLIDWWEKDGKSFVLYLAVAAVLVGGYYGWKNHRIAARAAASESVASAYTTEEIEEAVSKHGGSDAATALKLRLAKSYFDAGRYEEALQTYENLQAPAEFADIPVVGKAHCLEALGKYGEAQKAFDAFAEANPSNYLALTAQIGAARCVCEAGDKAKALERIATLKAANKEEGIAKARVEAAETAIKRYVAKVDAPAAK